MRPGIPATSTENLHFLCIEVDNQLDHLKQYLKHNSLTTAQRILERSGYAYNLKARIHRSCINQLSQPKLSEQQKILLRSVEFTATGLERITEQGRELVHQQLRVKKPDLLQQDASKQMLNLMQKGIRLIEPALLEHDSGLAIKLAKLANDIDKRFNRLFDHYNLALSGSEHCEDLVRGLFVAQSLRQMGDTLQHMGDALLSANLGQTINIERYDRLNTLMDGFQNDDAEKLGIKPLAETKSGSAISAITSAANYVAVMKDGAKKKVKEERQGVNRWHQIYPGVAPQILSYQKTGDSAALLIEHLPGETLESIVLADCQEQSSTTQPQKKLDESLKTLSKTLKSIWNETRTEQPINADFMGQLQKRLPDVYKIHPGFRHKHKRLCGLEIASFDELVKQTAKKEKQLNAPFSVHIHGDFNLDNIIYDTDEKRIHLIDLHRSRYMDYVQDISVFMVSAYRLRVFDYNQRQRVLRTPQFFYRSIRHYAKKQQDHTFELRMALALARSFATSTRFILDSTLSTSMMLRARYLLESFAHADLNKPDKFRIPIEEIFS